MVKVTIFTHRGHGVTYEYNEDETLQDIRDFYFEHVTQNKINPIPETPNQFIFSIQNIADFNIQSTNRKITNYGQTIKEAGLSISGKPLILSVEQTF